MKSVVLASSVALLLGAVYPVNADQSDGRSSVERNKQTARIWFDDVVVKQDRSRLGMILAKDVVFELPPSMRSHVSGDSKVVGADQVIKHAEAMNKRKKVVAETAEVIGEGNKVAVLRYEAATDAHGTRTGAPWVMFFDFNDDGKITRIRNVTDTAYAAQQQNSPNK
jgi:ketosteroid isomerase-like protein